MGFGNVTKGENRTRIKAVVQFLFNFVCLLKA